MTPTPQIGLFGGSFDPIHKGHLYLAEMARKTLSLDRVLLIPAFIPPHKTSVTLLDSEHRIRMIRLAIADTPWLGMDESEIRRKGVSYTIDTVIQVKNRFPDANLYFLIGSDSLLELWTWRRIGDLARLVTFVVLKREDRALPDSMPELEEKLKGQPLKTVHLNAPPLPISSTQIRERIIQGADIKPYLPAKVWDYIRQKALYA